MCLEGRVPFDRPFHVPQGGFRAVAVTIVNGGRDRIVINESAEGPPGVVDQIDRVVDQLRIVGRILPLEDVMAARDLLLQANHLLVAAIVDPLDRCRPGERAVAGDVPGWDGQNGVPAGGGTGGSTNLTRPISFAVSPRTR